MASFQMDPSTVKVDWALDGPVPWASTPAYAPGALADRPVICTRSPIRIIGNETTGVPLDQGLRVRAP